MPIKSNPILAKPLLLLAWLFLTAWTNQAEAQVNRTPIAVDGGLVTGVDDASRHLAVYWGIPYAAPPVGKRRWQEPQPVIPWEGIRKADSPSSICFQPAFPDTSWINKEFYPDGLPPMSEDCLYLNVWTPARTAEDKLPVIFWIHGGGLDHGWGHEMEFSGEAFARKGVILVTINYRVNVFGFLAHPWLDQASPQGISGNYGTLDQLAALRWVGRNIAKFGGDPDRITIMGQSAGARSTMALLSSPLSKGLFRQAIIQSGGGYLSRIPVPTLQEREEICKAFVAYTGVRNAAELYALPGEELLRYFLAFNEERGSNANAQRLTFTPNVDGYVLPADFEKALDSGQQHLVPALIGYTAQDIWPKEKMQRAAAEWSLRREKQNQPQTYVYLFQRPLPGDGHGAFHSSELWYMFGTLDRCWRPFTPADHRLSEEMVSYWTHFARTGNPNGPGLPRWETYNEAQPFIRILDVR